MNKSCCKEIIFLLRVPKYFYIKAPYFFPLYRGDDKSLARPGRKQITAIEDFECHISYL